MHAVERGEQISYETTQFCALCPVMGWRSAGRLRRLNRPRQPGKMHIPFSPFPLFDTAILGAYNVITLDPEGILYEDSFSSYW
jgi:hypothetical protein